MRYILTYNNIQYRVTSEVTLSTNQSVTSLSKIEVLTNEHTLVAIDRLVNIVKLSCILFDGHRRINVYLTINGML